MNFNVKRLISKSVDTPTDTNSATEKVKKYQQLCFELRERRHVYKVKVTASNHKISCRGGGLRELKGDLRELFDEKTTERLAIKMQRQYHGKAKPLLER